ncbi:hypothetical protein A2634_02415 [Candidatus Amesbacteria bacterium RIFCSPHIGHO2_01_FULL_48_32]|uniref:SpoVT-AbrB domain-containing protein n=1 Tax=Candidatus Amesbacteria bacterium RIFCSPLOWO2_01_FULL_48_25 TaxID=1797259 RepID=A0A1F4ZFM6_9BACT|nr:MAG: hypothetical protein A2634_02415 [Candidatus Amesbacteria bacterium RIFCSPHIGHO2_01_FULL_48_32]OGD04437.1 MAG: hypothetical protein A2989_05415 [Candidatus Amesbacteria bacterium RIFCSPLOWO2_01_FULL_48_25]HJZ06281.1 AbrB/MazE/SpoVT family DNA-binding domain-containing protein [Patescibacteria group bacterium]
MTQIVRTLRSGQITIPAPFREELGISADSLLQMTVVGSELRIRPVSVVGVRPDPAWLKRLYDQFGRARKRLGTRSEKEINEVVDKAVAAVRAGHD